MKESFWTAYIFIIGLVVITFIFLFQSLTNSDEHNMALLKETTEGAMYDAIDFQYLKSYILKQVVFFNNLFLYYYCI